LAVFNALMYYAGRYGQIFPSLRGLAYMAGCCADAVSTALNELEALGLITRHRRRKKVRTALGFKVVQDTNAYEVHEPRTALGRLMLQLFGKSSGRSARGSDSPEARASSIFPKNKKNYCKPETKQRAHAPDGGPEQAAGPLLRALERLGAVLKPA
jgi:DNA-binding transcriptional MocR family regulator